MSTLNYGTKYENIYQRYVFSIFGIGSTVLSICLFITNANKFYNESVLLFLSFLMLPIAGFYMFWMGFFSFFDLFSIATEIDLNENEVIGRSYFLKRSWSMKYLDIESIIRPKGFLGLSLKKSSMHVKSFNGKCLYIGTDVENFGLCIQELRKKAINVKKVDYGEWPSVDTVWNR
jgi:hypothetical protein